MAQKGLVGLKSPESKSIHCEILRFRNIGVPKNQAQHKPVQTMRHIPD